MPSIEKFALPSKLTLSPWFITSTPVGLISGTTFSISASISWQGDSHSILASKPAKLTPPFVTNLNVKHPEVLDAVMVPMVCVPEYVPIIGSDVVEPLYIVNSSAPPP